jgi:hypothetical protein
MTPWTDKEIARFTARVGLFSRRGASAEIAERLADRLAERDQDRDDRRMCVECAHLQRDGGCFMARHGRLHGGVRRDMHPIRDLLQRCERFEWQIP